MIIVNPMFYQILVENIEEEERFSASPASCDDFHQPIPLSGNESVQVFLPLNNHALHRFFVQMHTFSA